MLAVSDNALVQISSVVHIAFGMLCGHIRSACSIPDQLIDHIWICQFFKIDGELRMLM